MTSPKKLYVIIVDPYSSGSLFASEFIKYGCEVIAVLSSPVPPDVYASSYRPQDFGSIYIASEMSLDKLISSLKFYCPLCVLAGCESGVELAEEIAPLLVPEISNSPRLALARRDKGLMAEAVFRAGIPMMKQICTNDIAEVWSWVEQNALQGKDLVVKPPKSASTDGVSKIPKGKGLETEFFELLNKSNRLGIINDKVLVQEFLTGTEYVVDSFSYGGIHTVCSVCKYTKLANINGMAIYDRMDWVSANNAIVEKLVSYAERVLNALEVEWGNAHIEIMMTQEGPRLIELGARPHGGGHPKLCFTATGDSQVHRTVAFFAKATRPPLSYNLLQSMAVVFLRANYSAVVVEVSRLHALKELPSYVDSSIKIKNSDRVPATTDLFGTLALGFFVLSHPDPHQLEQDVIAVRLAESAVFQELPIEGS